MPTTTENRLNMSLPTNLRNLPAEEVASGQSLRGGSTRSSGRISRVGGITDQRTAQRMEAERRATELTKLGRATLEEKQRLAAELNQALSNRNLTLQERKNIQASFQQKLYATERAKQTGEARIRAGGSYQELQIKTEEIKPKIMSETRAATQQAQQRQTTFTRMVEQAKREKQEAFDQSFAGKFLTSIRPKPNYQTSKKYKELYKEGDFPSIIRKGAEDVGLFIQKKVSSPTTQFLSGTRPTPEQEKTLGKMTGEIFLFGTLPQTQAARATARTTEDAILDVKTTQASPNVKDIQKFKNVKDTSGTSLSLTKKQISQGEVFESKVLYESGKTDTFRYLSLGKSQDVGVGELGRARIYGYKVGSGKDATTIAGGEISLGKGDNARSVIKALVEETTEKPAITSPFMRTKATTKTTTDLQEYVLGTNLESKALKVGEPFQTSTTRARVNIISEEDIPKFLLGKNVPSTETSTIQGFQSRLMTGARVSFQESRLGRSLIAEKRFTSFGRSAESVNALPDVSPTIIYRPSRAAKGFSGQTQALEQTTVLETPSSSTSSALNVLTRKIVEPKVPTSQYAGLGLYEQTAGLTSVTIPKASSVFEFPKTTTSSTTSTITGVVRPIMSKQKANASYEIQKPNVTSKTIVDTIPKVDTGFKDVTKQSKGEIIRQNVNQGNTQKSNQGQGQGVGQGSGQLSGQSTTELQVPRTTTTTNFKIPKQPRIPKTPKIPIIAVPSTPTMTKAMNFVKKGGDIFEVLGRRFGQELSIIKTPSKREAEKAQLKFLKGTLGRSSVITKGGKKVKSSLLSSPEFRPSKADPFRVVQKSEYSLGTGKEKSEIQFFKKKKKKKKRGLL